jgi:hypothetical protein
MLFVPLPHSPTGMTSLLHLNTMTNFSKTAFYPSRPLQTTPLPAMRPEASIMSPNRPMPPYTPSSFYPNLSAQQQQSLLQRLQLQKQRMAESSVAQPPTLPQPLSTPFLPSLLGANKPAQ